MKREVSSQAHLLIKVFVGRRLFTCDSDPGDSSVSDPNKILHYTDFILFISTVYICFISFCWSMLEFTLCWSIHYFMYVLYGVYVTLYLMPKYTLQYLQTSCILCCTILMVKGKGENILKQTSKLYIHVLPKTF